MAYGEDERGERRPAQRPTGRPSQRSEAPRPAQTARPQGRPPVGPDAYQRQGRPWSQRLVLGGSVLLAGVSLIVALALLVVQRNLEQVKRVDTRTEPVGETKTSAPLTVESNIEGIVKSTVVDLAPTNSLAPISTVAPGELKSVNFLMTGSDNRDCIDPNSPYASTFMGGGTPGGSRPDTIMLVHVEETTGQVGLLSFPRDLWVPVAGTNKMSKLNATFNKNDPTRLIATIESFFQIPIDHYVSIDFCVFKDLVNAVGGIKIPFLTALKDNFTKLNVPKAGCFKFDGDHALAYVRSRHLQFKNEASNWKAEGTADIGRIKRQQDFIRRVMNAVQSKGALNIGLVTKLVRSFERRVVVDANLTAKDVLNLAGALKGFDPSTTRSFIIEGKITNVGPQSVVDPDLSGSRMRTILTAFRGDTYLKNIPSVNQNNVYGTKSILPDPKGKC